MENEEKKPAALTGFNMPKVTAPNVPNAIIPNGSIKFPDKLSKCLEDARKSGGYMIAVFVADENGNLTIERHWDKDKWKHDYEMRAFSELISMSITLGIQQATERALLGVAKQSQDGQTKALLSETVKDAVMEAMKAATVPSPPEQS